MGYGILLPVNGRDKGSHFYSGFPLEEKQNLLVNCLGVAVIDINTQEKKKEGKDTLIMVLSLPQILLQNSTFSTFLEENGIKNTCTLSLFMYHH